MACTIGEELLINWTAGPLTITDDGNEIDVKFVHSQLSTSYWAPGIPESLVAKSIQNSLCFGVFLEGSQIGFARVITDRATFAYLADVFIVEEHRGKGYGKTLVRCVTSHPDLQGLRRMVLVTRDAHSLYSEFGFSRLAKPENYMELAHPGLYLRQNEAEPPVRA